MNIRIVMIAAALLLTSAVRPSSAVTFDEFKMVGASGSTEVRSTFNLSETPYLYFKLAPATDAKVLTAWLNGSDTYGLSALTTTSNSEGWLALANWDSAGKTGNWEVKGYLKTGRTVADCKTASFVVTPEPIAMILYGLGGLPIAAHLLRRRKTGM